MKPHDSLDASDSERQNRHTSSAGSRFAWVDKITGQVVEEQARLRNRFIVVAAFGATIIFLGKAIAGLAGDLGTNLILIDLLNALMWPVVVLVGLRLGTSRKLLANLIASLCLTQIGLIYFGSGGQNVGSLFALAVIPMITMVLADWRSAIWFSLASVALALSTLWLPVDLLTGPAGWEGEGTRVALARDVILLIIGMTVLAMLVEWLQRSAVSSIRASQEQAESSKARTLELVNQQAILLAAAERLQMTDSENLNDRATEILRLVASLAGAEYASLTLFDSDFRESRARYHWCKPEIARLQTEWQFPATIYRWSAKLLTRNGFLAVDDLDKLPPEARPERNLMQSRRVKSWFSASVQAGPGANGILSIQSHTHHHTWLDEEITSIRLMAGILAGVVGRHQAGEAIRDRDAIFARVFAAHPEGLVIFRLEDGAIIECNKGFCLIADFDSRENAIGSSLQSLSWITQPRAGESLWSRIEPVGNLEETEIQVKQGEAGALQLIVSAIPIDMANVPCGLMLLRDITKQRELEIQLRQAQKMEAVGLLAGGIAHNFNNMLTVISGFSEVLLDSVEDELRNDVKSIWEAAQRSSALTRQLLAFSRRQVLQTEIIDLGELVAEQEQMLAPLIGEDIIIQLNLSDTVMHVEVDRGQIEQVMMNLATNARDAMPNGGDLTFSTREVMLQDDLANSLGLSPDHFACIRVEDSGVGMAEEVIARAFEPFYTTKEKGAGSGLGLSTAHGIIEQSGGAISIQSELGHGTSIDVYLPLTDRAARKSNRLTAREQTLDHTETILLVEDEAEVRRLAQVALEAAGYQIIAANHGEEALEKASRFDGPIDLLLTDVVMPVMGGVRLAEAIQLQRPDIKVAMMTGYPGGTPAESELGTNAYRMIAKPIGPHELCRAVALVLKDEAVSKPGAPAPPEAGTDSPPDGRSRPPRTA